MKTLRDQIRGPIARGTIRTTAVLGIRLVIQAGTLLLVARMLGPNEFGAFVGIAALAVILGTLATFGSHLVLLGEVSKAPSRRNDVLPWAIPTTLVCGTALLGVYLLICVLGLGGSDIPLRVLLAIGATEMWLQPLFGLPAAEHLALGRVARSQLLQTLPLALRLAAAASVFAVRPGSPLAAYAYGYCAASIIALAVAFHTLPAAWPAPRHWRAPRFSELRETAGYAALNITGASPAELDKTIALRLLPLGAAGLYAAGARVIGAATLPVAAMLLAALPRLFREGQDKPKRTAQLLRAIFGVALAYSLVLTTVLWLAAPVLSWLFGADYRGLDHTIRWLCLAVPGMALRIAAGNVLMALGKPWMRVGFEIGGIAVLLIAAALLTVRFGAIGMPLALACSEWGMALCGWMLVVPASHQRATDAPP